jgi:transposase
MHMVMTVPDATLQEYIETIEEAFGIQASTSTLCKLLTERGITRKKAWLR